jgi:hypothetical protein
VALSRQVVDFIRLNLLDDTDQVGRICQIPVVKGKASIFLKRILIKVVDSGGVE